MIDAAVTALRDVPEDVVRAAGGVVHRVADGGDQEFALIHRPAYDDWSLPKGKLKNSERLEVAALREVEEETGLQCLIDRSLGTVSYVDRRGRDKVVWYWLMRPVQGKFAPTDEVDRMSWLEAGEAVRALSYPHDRELLERAIAAL